METVKMYIVNIDGKTIEKEVETNLVSIYKSMGWAIKEEQQEPKQEKPIQISKKERSFSNSKRFSK